MRQPANDNSKEPHKKMTGGMINAGNAKVVTDSGESTVVGDDISQYAFSKKACSQG